MAVNVIVIRGAGEKPGPDIINSLCTTESVAVAAGTQFIDENHKNKVQITATGPLRQWMAPGSLVEVIDSEAANYRAQLNGIVVDIVKETEVFQANVQLTLEKIADE